MPRPRRSTRQRPAVFLSFLVLGSGIVAQSTGKKPVLASAVSLQAVAAPGAGDDEDFAKSVRAWTTRPELISPMVDHLPSAAGIPSPNDGLGPHIGEPKNTTY